MDAPHQHLFCTCDEPLYGDFKCEHCAHQEDMRRFNDHMLAVGEKIQQEIAATQNASKAAEIGAEDRMVDDLCEDMEDMEIAASAVAQPKKPKLKLLWRNREEEEGRRKRAEELPSTLAQLDMGGVGKRVAERRRKERETGKTAGIKQGQEGKVEAEDAEMA